MTLQQFKIKKLLIAIAVRLFIGTIIISIITGIYFDPNTRYCYVDSAVLTGKLHGSTATYNHIRVDRKGLARFTGINESHYLKLRFEDGVTIPLSQCTLDWLIDNATDVNHYLNSIEYIYRGLSFTTYKTKVRYLKINHKLIKEPIWITTHNTSDWIVFPFKDEDARLLFGPPVFVVDR